MLVGIWRLHMWQVVDVTVIVHMVGHTMLCDHLLFLSHTPNMMKLTSGVKHKPFGALWSGPCHTSRHLYVRDQ